VTQTWHDQWADVDKTGDPNWFIRFLDASRGGSLAAIKQDPRQFYSYLGVREGQHILDVGSGTGDLTRPLAALVGPAGRVVGVDYSQTMVDEAQRRAAEEGSPVEFIQGDIHSLPFEEAEFDVVQVRLVFQHLRDPHPALAELVRVLKPGGRLAILEQDWETLVIDATDRALTRRIVNLFNDALPNGWIGRQLYGLLKEVGLERVAATGSLVMLPNYEVVSALLGFDHVLDRLREQGQAADAEIEAWQEDLRLRSQEGRFMTGFTIFTATGHKPLSEGEAQ
jgi:ubiquinone/menaquinone biosynthesis C-methylase UbiE